MTLETQDKSADMELTTNLPYCYFEKVWTYPALHNSNWMHVYSVSGSHPVCVICISSLDRLFVVSPPLCLKLCGLCLSLSQPCPPTTQSSELLRQTPAEDQTNTQHITAAQPVTTAPPIKSGLTLVKVSKMLWWTHFLQVFFCPQSNGQWLMVVWLSAVTDCWIVLVKKTILCNIKSS